MHSSITLALLCLCVSIVTHCLSQHSSLMLHYWLVLWFFVPYVRTSSYATFMMHSLYEDCCLMSTYEYWCCWCCCTYRVVPYDPSSVLAPAAVVNRRSISLPRCIAPSSYEYLSPSPCVLFFKNEKRQLWVRLIEWLKLNIASYVVHRTRSLGVLIL